MAATSVLFFALGCSDSSRVLDLANELAAQFESAPAGTDAETRGASDGDSTGSDTAGAVAVAQEVERAAEATSASGMRTYYQYIDDTGSVRFVSSLEDVPEKWRDRAGSVEMAGTPPSSPADRRADLDRRRARARAVLAAAPSSPRANSGSNLEVQLYYATWCGYCRKAKAYLDSAGVSYDLRDVDNPSIAAELQSRTGRGGIPVLYVGDEYVRGYDRPGIDRLIAKL